MSVLKKIFIVIFLIFCILCLGINGWWLYISNFGAEKVVSHTFEVGLQTTTDGNTKYFMEVNSYDNCFEIKFNYMLDENQEAFYSQGMQYYFNEFGLGWIHSPVEEGKEFISSDGWWLWKEEFYKYYSVTSLDSSNCNYWNYASGDDWQNALNSSNPIGNETRFKIQLGSEDNTQLYLMGFKGSTHNFDEKALYATAGDNRYYHIYSPQYLACLLYESIQTLPYGTNKAVIFEFADMFNYYEYLGNGVFSEEPLKETSKLENEIKSYYSIKITKNEGKIQKASQSLFNCVNGSSNFNVSKVESANYFYGRTSVSVNNSMFNLVSISDKHIALKLKDSFIEGYEPYTNKIYLDILIDLDYFKSEGYEFVGFTSNSGLENFVINSCRSVETIDNELVYSEVAYA